jgi:translocation and assembly module TamB
MTRPGRIALLSVAAVVAILAILTIGGISVARSVWLREKVRERIVAEAEKATGGRVEISDFRFDWSTLTAQLDDLTIHGTEPAGEAPLLAIKRVLVGLKIVSLLRRDFDVARVEVDGPRAHLIVQTDGATNLPRPKTPRAGKTGPETILDLKIGKFNLTDGLVLAEQTGRQPVRSRPWNARGENLNASVAYSAAGSRYEGAISVAPLHLAWSGYPPVDVQVTAKASMEKNRLTISSASLKTSESQFDLSDLQVNSFTAPITTGQYSAKVSLAEADRIFKLVNFRHTGAMNAAGNVRFVSLTDYQVSGGFHGSGIGYGKVSGVSVAGNISADPYKVLVNGLRVSALGGVILASGRVSKFEDFQLTGRLEHFDARALADLGGVPALPYDGILSGPFEASGKLPEPAFHRLAASATLAVSPAGSGPPLRGEVAASYDGVAGTIKLGHSWLELPNTRVDVTGVLGQRLDVQFQSKDLADLQPALAPGTLPITLRNGSFSFSGPVTGPLTDPRIAGHAAIQNAIYEGQQVDSATGDFVATKTEVRVSNAALAWGSLRARTSGSIGLRDWKVGETSAINAATQITNADITKLLALVDQKNVLLSGTLNTMSQVTGTIGDLRATADLTLSKGQIYGEPYDSVSGRAQYLNRGAQVLTATVNAGSKRLNIAARFDHSPATFLPGKLIFSASSNSLPLNQIVLARNREPDLRGNAQIKADGAIQLNRNQASRLDFDILELNADVNATGLAMGVKQFGDLRMTARTKNDILTARVDSNAAMAAIKGGGTVRLSGNYPVEANLTFSNLGLNALATAMGVRGRQKDLNFDGSAAGEVTLRGPAKRVDLIEASFDLTQIEVHPLAISGQARNIPDLALRNNGPVRLALSKSIVRVENARFQAPQTSLEVSGTVALNEQSPLNLRVQGNMNLALAEALNTDLMSSGELVINAALRGTYANPDLAGRAELQRGDFHYAEFSNGLTNANGVILFNGTRATIESLTAETGGGKVDATGFAALASGTLAFRVEGKAHEVRLRYPEGVSSVSDAEVTLAGTTQRSEASGTVTLRRISINPKSDLSSILASAAQPVKTPESTTGLLANLNLDVQIETAPDVAFQTSVAQSIEADANLRLRGTATNPAVLGRINITQGELVFFGNKYTINQGSVSFFNPARIEPILNVDLETRARGVDITLTVTGPINKLNVSYRSDPPLQFSDIVALLATGRAPTDPTLAVRDTGQSQNLQQLGASALIGQAIANPVAGRLQRFFGVSKIKIDPQLTGITGSPEARLTIEQQVTPELLFTYISDVSSTSTQLIRVEWDFNRRWSAILTREENGYVGIDFAFRKRFR